MATQDRQPEMSTGTSVRGYIATDPKLTYGKTGVPRFYARFKQLHTQEMPDGTRQRLDPSFHTVVAFNAEAEAAYQNFSKRDPFIASGYIRTPDPAPDGTPRDKEFVADIIRPAWPAAGGTSRVPQRTPPEREQTQSAPRRADPAMDSPFEAPQRTGQQPATPVVGR